MSAGRSVALFPRDEVDARFETGGLLLDAGAYKLDAGRRTTPGEVEYHEHVVDVMHVVRGTATVLTGGEMQNAREISPGELRASAIAGGVPQRLGKGDVLAIPSGVPHQFVEVSNPFLYFVVKVEV
jgi:mannose-6-phosphate isomerase-like protein (cupin superfamily)